MGRGRNNGDCDESRDRALGGLFKKRRIIAFPCGRAITRSDRRAGDRGGATRLAEADETKL